MGKKISGGELLRRPFNIQLLLAATATTIVVAATILLTATAAVTIAAEEDDYQDDDPRTRVVITKNITHKFVPPLIVILYTIAKGLFELLVRKKFSKKIFKKSSEPC